MLDEVCKDDRFASAMRNETGLNNHLPFRCTPSGYLPTFLINMLAIIPACFVIACTKYSNGEDCIVTAAEPEIQVDSLKGTISFNSIVPLRRIDLYIYPLSEPGMLEDHLVLEEEPFRAEIKSSEYNQDKRVLAIGNSSIVPDKLVMQRYDSAERIIAGYEQAVNDSGYQLQSAAMEYTVGTDAVVTLVPLTASITVRSVSNMIGGYVLIEEPVFYLSEISAGTELFRQTGFFPIETLPASDTVKSGCDVGMFTQYPNRTLFCLPDESGSTALVMECGISGHRCRFCQQTGPLVRGANLIADYEISSSEDWSCTMYPAPHQ